MSAGELHPLIKERVKILRDSPPDSKGQYVLYWMHTAVRTSENPALDVAMAEAAARKLPLVVASFLLGCHTYPTHRRYKFLLEGLADAQLGLKAMVLTYLTYLLSYDSLLKPSMCPTPTQGNGK